MKNLLCFLIIMISLGEALADNVSNNIKFLSDLIFTESSSSHNYNILYKLRGDTITIDFSGVPYIKSFTKERPDTIWLKQRPKKNPKEGKHYDLSFAYKGIKIDNEYITKSADVKNKQFAVLSVDSSQASDLYSSGKNYNIKLVDIEDLSILNWTIPYNDKNCFIIKSLKADRILNSLKGQKIYVNKSTLNSMDYKPAIIQDGSYQLLLDNTGIINKISSTVILDIVDPEGYQIPFTFDKLYSYGNDKILSEAEYEDKYLIRTINSEINEELLNSDIVMPFNFYFIFAIPENNLKRMSQKIDPSKIDNYSWSSSYNDAPQKPMLLGGSLTVKGKEFYKMLYNGKAFFMRAEDVKIPEEELVKLDSLKRSTKEVQDIFFQRSLDLSKGMYYNNLNKALNEMNTYKKYGLAILEWELYDESEYTEGTGINITFFNPTDQMIKYISITFQGYNAVDDPYGKPITRKCIGPIEPDELGTYQFEYTWFSDIIEYAKIKSINVTYKNGTSKTISNPTRILLSDDLLNILFSKNEVKSFD